MKKIELMIFDLDGTLITSGNDLAAAVNHSLKMLNMAQLDKQIIIGYVGDGIHKLIERSLGKEHQDKYEQALKLFMEYYDVHMLDTTGLYPGVVDTLQYFDNTRKVIVTNKRYAYTKKITHALNIDSYFDEIIGSDNGPAKKPDPQILYRLMSFYASPSDRTVVIGDGLNDVMLAQNAGAVSCAFLNGLTDRQLLLDLNPDYTYESIEELKKVFF